MRIIASVAASAASILMSGAAWAQAPSNAPYNWGPHMMWWGGTWYTMIFGPLFMIVFLVLLVGVVVFLVRGPNGPTQGRPTPLDILKERYARGEIDKAEFDDRRRTLGV